MTEHEQNFAWRFFKDDHFADAANIKEKNNL
jgi:hypothetical protein